MREGLWDMKKYIRGSEWRKWDLHVHTASSYDANYNGADYNDLLVASWKEKNFAAVAVTDHFLIDTDRITDLRSKAPNITIFPGVELRTDKGGCNIHVILVFSEEVDVKTLSDDFNAIMLRQKAKNLGDNSKIYWDYDDIVEFARNQDAIISLHAGSKTSGVDDKITNALQVAQAIKEEYAKTAHIFEMGKVKDISDYKTKVFPDIQDEKPLILCSDNHDPRTYDVKEYLWLKADPTFCGLKQVINHPSERVFVGNIPKKIDQASKNPEKYIDSFSVQRKLTARNSEKWFDFELPLNIGLVSVIGNKGSGKSAFSDIIAHVCCSRNVDKSSFLSDTRFRKKPTKYADDYESEIVWKSGTKTATESLQENKSGVELIKYLPQSYIEKVCNELDDSFQSEIDSVIFSYIDESERGNSTSLEQLIEMRTSAINSEMNQLRSQLNEINKEIIAYEKKSVPAYQQDLTDMLVKLKTDYDILCKNPPAEVVKPIDGLDAEKDTDIQTITEYIINLTSELKKQREKIVIINSELSELDSLIDDIDAINASILDVNNRVDRLSISNEALKKWRAEVSVDRKTLEEFRNIKEKERISLIELTKQYTDEMPELDEKDIKNSYDSLLKAKNSFDWKIKLTEVYKSMLTNETTLAQRQYQKYLDDKKEWELKKASIMGDEQTKDTIKHFEKEIEYVSKELLNILDSKRGDRLNIVGKIFVCYEKKVETYATIYQPIESKLANLLSNIDDEVRFTAGISAKKDLPIEIIKLVNKKIKSQVYGVDGAKKLNDIFESTTFSEKTSVLEFVNQIFDYVTNETDIEKIIIGDRLEFCNYAAGLNYLDVDFNLTMGNLTLEEMSPGQRGTVLLIFYLALDKDDAPLIIDQPEDNLDNQSVFDKLVPCILAAKKSRQIIIVTHNPNIAIACDAEQIISCKIDKHTHEITYMSGSIEEAEIKDSVVKILEGTQPAFDLRNKKYSFYGNKAVTT